MPEYTDYEKKLRRRLACWADGWITMEGSDRIEYVETLELLGIDSAALNHDTKKVRTELLRISGATEEEIQQVLKLDGKGE